MVQYFLFSTHTHFVQKKYSILNFLIDREFINLINFLKYLKFPCDPKSTCTFEQTLQQQMAVLPLTLLSASSWPQIWNPQGERCPISINDIFDMHNTAVWYRDSGTVTALQKGGSLQPTCTAWAFMFCGLRQTTG